MSFNKHPPDLGAPEPELRTSPIFPDFDAEREVVDTAIPEERICYFNGESFTHGSYVKSGSMILQCDRGAWVETGLPDKF